MNNINVSDDELEIVLNQTYTGNRTLGTTASSKSCLFHVFSSRRDDFGGHQCNGKISTTFNDSYGFCSRHFEKLAMLLGREDLLGALDLEIVNLYKVHIEYTGQLSIISTKAKKTKSGYRLLETSYGFWENTIAEKDAFLTEQDAIMAAMQEKTKELESLETRFKTVEVLLAKLRELFDQYRDI